MAEDHNPFRASQVEHRLTTSQLEAQASPSQTPKSERAFNRLSWLFIALAGFFGVLSFLGAIGHTPSQSDLFQIIFVPNPMVLALITIGYVAAVSLAAFLAFGLYFIRHPVARFLLIVFLVLCIFQFVFSYSVAGSHGMCAVVCLGLAVSFFYQEKFGLFVALLAIINPDFSFLFPRIYIFIQLFLIWREHLALRKKVGQNVLISNPFSDLRSASTSLTIAATLVPVLISLSILTLAIVDWLI